jgi:hypothetical protein
LASNALPGDDSVVYFEQAQKLYRRWGAKGVVNRLWQKRDHATVYSPALEGSRQGYKSRERFDQSLVEEHKALDLSID